MKKLVIIFSTITLQASEYSDLMRALVPTMVRHEMLEGGMSNNIALCHTPTQKVIFRSPKKKSAPERFAKILDISQKAARLKLAPEIYNVDEDNQCVVMQHMDAVPWPSYESNIQPYHATMQLLRCYHNSMRPEAQRHTAESYAPLGGALKSAEKLTHYSEMPEQLHRACAIMKGYQQVIAPWLTTHATWYHGDFKLDNVLLVPFLEKSSDILIPWLIDFDSANIGDPFFDVVKFSQKLEVTNRLALLQAYLQHDPTASEIEHFKIADNGLRMVVANIRLHKAVEMMEKAQPDQPLLSKVEMQQLLDSTEPLPAQSTIPLSDVNPQKQQLAAVYALHAFLSNS